MSPGLGTAALALWRAGLATGQSYDPAWAEKVYSSGALSGFLSPCTRRKPSSNGVVSAVRKSRASRRSFLTRQERQFIISYCGYCIVCGAARLSKGEARPNGSRPSASDSASALRLVPLPSTSSAGHFCGIAILQLTVIHLLRPLSAFVFFFLNVFHPPQLDKMVAKGRSVGLGQLL